MVDQLSSFADEVTRVATEVGTEGKLGGQAEVKGVSGTWRDLTESVNELANNLTGQVRNIAQVTTAVANGDLTQQITVDARGEILELKKTINTMVDQLSSFADEVTRVAREVGTEGILGGQAEVEGVSGTWQRPDRVGQPARVDADHAAARDGRRGDRGDRGRPDAADRGRGGGRGRRAEGPRERDDREPPRHDEAERRAGLAEDEPRADLGRDAGPARPAGGVAAAGQRDLAARRRAGRRVLPRRPRRGGQARAAARRLLRPPARRPQGRQVQVRRGAAGPGGASR